MSRDTTVQDIEVSRSTRSSDQNAADTVKAAASSQETNPLDAGSRKRRAAGPASPPPLPLQESSGTAQTSASTGATATSIPTATAAAAAATCTLSSLSSFLPNGSHSSTDENAGCDVVGPTLNAVLAQITSLEEEKQALLADVVMLDGPLQAEMAALEREREALTSAQAALEEAVTAAAESRQTLQTRVHGLSETFAQKKDAAQRAVLQSVRLREQLHRLESDRDEAKRQRSANALANRDALREQQTLEQALAALQSERASLADELEQREVALLERHAQVARARADLATLRAASVRLRNDADGESNAVPDQTAEQGVRQRAPQDPLDAAAGALAAHETLAEDTATYRDQLASLQSLYARVEQALASHHSPVSPPALMKQPCAELEQTQLRLESSRAVCERARHLSAELERLLPDEEKRYNELR